MAETAGEHRFVAVVEAGIGLTPTAVAVEVALEGAEPVTVQAGTYGPGDVRALDAGAVTRRLPPAGTAAFEPNLFAAIELAHPALPWALAPPRSPRLPWLVLIVVEDVAGVRVDRSGELAALVLDAPFDIERELPDLTQSWAWVHAHGTGNAGAPIDAAAFAHSAEPTCARLVCPRRLEPRRRYHAALVPAFRAGVRAALGEDVDRADDALAWTAAARVPLRLPAYSLWSFSTGDGGDFASLARQIVPVRVGAEASGRELDAAAPGWGVGDVPGRVVVAGGVLLGDGPPPAQSPDGDALGATILAMIDAAPGDDPLLAPPLYGAAAAAVTGSADAPRWLVRLNGDVRLRIAAGAGAAIVRARQDELVDAAWRQLGDAEDANRVLRHSELASAINQRVQARYVERVPDEDLVQVIRPAHRRMRLADPRRAIEPGNTLAADIEESAMPNAAGSAAFRRFTRPGSRFVRRAGGAAGGAVLERANAGDLDVVPARVVPDGSAAFDDISIAEHIQPRWSSARPRLIADAAAEWRRAPVVTPEPRIGVITAALRSSHIPAEVDDWTPPLPSENETQDPPTIDGFAVASQAHQRYLVEHLGAIPLPRPRPPLVRGQLATIRQRFRVAASPARAVMPVLDARMAGHTLEAREPFRRVVLTPTFERPLLRDLAAIELAHVLPGFDRIPAESAALLEPDHGAVAAVLAGANHELAAELRWRGFPGDGRDTPLRTFWGRTRRERTGAITVVPDVPPLRDWADGGAPPPPVGIVIVLRGELFRRYPGAFVYLAEARWSGAHRVIGAAHRTPLFHATLDDATVLCGFELARATVIGGAQPGPPGWYVVIEEHPQEPRFGLGAGPAGPLHTWRDLAWAHVTDGDLRGPYLALGGPLVSRRPTDDDDARWGVDAAQQAAITLRRPTRIAIHASLLDPR